MKRLLIIGVGGAHSGSGKTTVAEALLRHLTGEGRGLLSWPPGTPLKWGALKYTKTAILTSIVDDSESLKIENKDTWRLLNAGAEHVVWLQAPPEDLQESLPLALSRLGHLDGVIVEGNSAIEFVKPDVILFIDTHELNRIKPSGRLLRARADIIIINDAEGGKDDSARYPPGKARSFSLSSVISDGSRKGVRGIAGLVSVMDDVIKTKRVESLLAERAQEGRISCADARRIAEEAGVAYGEVGKTANRLRIKIRNCELGCF